MKRHPRHFGRESSAARISNSQAGGKGKKKGKRKR